MIFKLSALTNSGIYSEWFNFPTFSDVYIIRNLRHSANVTSTLCLYCIHSYKRPIAVCKVNLLSITSKCKKNVLFVCLFVYGCFLYWIWFEYIKRQINAVFLKTVQLMKWQSNQNFVYVYFITEWEWTR